MTEPETDTAAPAPAFDPASLTRPVPELLTYYAVVALLTVVGAPFVFAPLLIKYKTMRYELDDEGVRMRWGFFFRHEITLTYRRLQDIHVTRNIVERWLGLAKVPVQTASGRSGATMTIEGCADPEGLRDFLYTRMRGAREGAAPASGAADGAPAGDDDDPATILREIRDELRRLREGGAP